MQYYIWHDDLSGILMLDALQKAADRGVRVRLLLDDNGVTGMDSHLAALAASNHFEVRLFNPSTVRHPKLAGYTFDFFRMNRRMHNKALIVDGAVAIVGGRNIGDEYFRVGDATWFVDLDVLAVGTVVVETAALFDAYWNSKSAFTVQSVVGGNGDAAALDARLKDVSTSAEAQALTTDLRNSAENFLRAENAIEWTDVQLLADDPIKGQGLAADEQLMITALKAFLGGVKQRLDLVSAYFIPGPGGTAMLSELARSGNEVHMLTNAMQTTDVLLVHAGYAKYRRTLLEAGVTLHELKPTGDMIAGTVQQILPFGASGASLHAKTFAIDESRVLVGSFNMDPRSVSLNCEMGFLIDSPALASQVATSFDSTLQSLTYRPALTPEGGMIWNETLEDGEIVTHRQEPDTTWFQRAALVLVGFLPIEWLL